MLAMSNIPSQTQDGLPYKEFAMRMMDKVDPVTREKEHREGSIAVKASCRNGGPSAKSCYGHEDSCT